MKEIQESKVLNNQATQLFMKGAYKEAEIKYIEAVKNDPKSHTTLSNLGFLYASMGNIDQAIERYGQSLAIEPHFVTAQLNLGIALMTQKKWDLARKTLEKACAMEEDNTLVWENLAKCYLAMDDYENAILAWQKLIALDPENSDGYIQLAVTFIALNKYDRAEYVLDHVVETYPRNHLAYTYMGIIANAKNNYGLAIEMYTHSLGLAPEDLFTRYNLALGFMALQRIDEATLEMERIYGIRNDLTEVNVDLAVLYIAQKRWEEANKLLNTVLKENPEHDKAIYYKGAVLLAQEQRAKAVLFLKEAVKRNSAYREDAQQLLNDLATED